MNNKFRILLLMFIFLFCSASFVSFFDRFFIFKYQNIRILPNKYCSIDLLEHDLECEFNIKEKRGSCFSSRDNRCQAIIIFREKK
jgi:hypothetical protein